MASPKKSTVLNRSCFLDYYNYFIKLGEDYSDRLEIVFRPHPFLKNTLYEIEEWGKVRTDAYFKLWETIPNLSISTGDYYDEFALSDLLVHDSVSFLAEYLVTGSPAIFTKRRIQLDPPFNDFGKICLQAHYVCSNEKELNKRIFELLFDDFDDFDEKKELRQSIVSQYLISTNDSSYNIYKIINTLIHEYN